jgi:hypothetical protein
MILHVRLADLGVSLLNKLTWDEDTYLPTKLTWESDVSPLTKLNREADTYLPTKNSD